ncbi:MAG TPA: glycosyltransferase family 4 protein [Thermoleophilia bacterium]
MRRIVVLNQFALPRSEGGGTRHIDLFGRLDGWAPLIIAANRSHATQRLFHTDDRRFRLVWVPEQHGGRVGRVVGWLFYAAEAFMITVTRRHLGAVYGSSPHLLAPLAGLMAARLRRVPFILEVRDLWPESIVAAGMLRSGSTLHRVLSRLERLLVTAADAIVVVTPGWEEHFAELGAQPDRVHVISNGTEVDEFALSEPRDALRAEFGISRFTAVYAGAHSQANDLDLLLDAALDVPEMDILLVGDGTRKRALQDRVREQRIRNVAFLDPLPKPELARLLHACDVGVHCIAPLPLLAKGMSPNKLFDYMAAGLPVVSNAQEGLRDVIVDGECGVLVGPRSLGSALRRVHDASEQQRATWGARGRDIVTDRFSRSAAATRLDELLAAVAGDQTADASGRYQIVHLTVVHRPTDNRIMRKECVSLHEAGLSVALLAVASRDDVFGDVPIVALPRRSNRLARMVVGPFDAWRALRRVRPTMIHVHDPELIPLAALWRLRPGRKAVYDAHEDLPKQVMGKTYIPRPLRRPVAKLARALEALADRQLDAIVAATPSIARNFTHARVVLVQNFPWLRDYPEPADPPVGEHPKVVYVGGISAQRGAAEMVQAIQLSRHDAELVLAGPLTGPAKELVERAPNARVRYLGVLPASQVPGIVAQASVGLVLFHPVPNNLESQPTKLFEYMAAARPFIASDFPSWRELVGNTGCGLFVDPLDVAAIRRSINQLLDDRESALEMGRRGRAAFVQSFTFECESAKLASMTRALVDD